MVLRPSTNWKAPLEIIDRPNKMGRIDAMVLANRSTTRANTSKNIPLNRPNPQWPDSFLVLKSSRILIKPIKVKYPASTYPIKLKKPAGLIVIAIPKII